MNWKGTKATFNTLSTFKHFIYNSPIDFVLNCLSFDLLRNTLSRPGQIQMTIFIAICLKKKNIEHEKNIKIKSKLFLQIYRIPVLTKTKTPFFVIFMLVWCSMFFLYIVFYSLGEVLFFLYDCNKILL